MNIETVTGKTICMVLSCTIIYTWFRFTSPSPQTLVAVNPSPPLNLIVLFIRTELVALLVGCRRCAQCMSARCVVVVAYHCWRENHCCCRRYLLLPWLLTISNQVMCIFLMNNCYDFHKMIYKS
ncbi:hypothetical protein Nepgr_000816 [Nepenthes gracilis]|uniref:Uncharacterized protein n=1 Tax=Nepenthes gracilis TaxID=150966 RepID=A0AAD3P4C5_NEPGR|nr:hypothetical protein Nepgr_000816 [Nepenthes gracilis]